jgi:DNA-binding CsgD family transcriptional regulator
VDESCRIVHANRRAASQLRRGFPSTAGERLPPEISRWLMNARSRGTAERMDLEITGAELPLAVRAASAEGGHWLLVLTETDAALLPALLQKRFQLTARQAELLYWLSKGRSNSEMGIIVGISARTVDKHLQHVFEKLDVENRHAAGVKALEALRPT